MEYSVYEHNVRNTMLSPKSKACSINENLVRRNLDFFLHSVVIETLKKVDPSRKCFRMVGGILSERTVNEVLPALQLNRTQVKIFFFRKMLYCNL